MVARPMRDFLMAPSGVPFTLKSDKHAPEQAHRGPGHPALGHRCSNNLGRAAEGTGQQLCKGSGPHIPSIWSCHGTKSIFSHLLRETSSLTWELWTGSRVSSVLSYDAANQPSFPGCLPVLQDPGLCLMWGRPRTLCSHCLTFIKITRHM